MGRTRAVQIAAYRHPVVFGSTQEPDTAAGPYYVSVKDGERWTIVSGPYDTHAEALALVGRARAISQQLDPKAVWYAFGTVRMREGFEKPGMLQLWGYDLQLAMSQPLESL